MSDFSGALWDGSDPSYAPLLSWSGKYPFWKPTKKYIKAGYAIKQKRLTGTKGDGQDLTRAHECRDLTREMLRWFEADTPKLSVGTWKWLIARFKTDEFSPFQRVKGNTAVEYTNNLKYWEDAIGPSLLSAATYNEISAWHRSMERKGRSVSFIKRRFTALRLVISYGAMQEIAEAQRIAGILSGMRFKTPAARQIAASPAQVLAIIASATREGEHGFALGISLMWWFTLRAVDVRGIWVKAETDNGGIVRNGLRWQDGLTWDMIERDLSSFSKVLSKTRASLPHAQVYPLHYVPEVQAMLAATPPEKRVGPVILTTRSEPYTTSGWSQAWRRHRRLCGIPDDVQMMDTRAGAVTDAKIHGASLAQRRDAAGHIEEKTTDRYSRTRDAGISAVVKLRRSAE